MSSMDRTLDAVQLVLMLCATVLVIALTLAVIGALILAVVLFLTGQTITR